MILRLAPLPDSLRGPDDEAYKGVVPRRARFLEPTAARSLTALLVECGNALVFTDVYRSPEASLAARRSKRGIQPPGFSAHNFGIAFDLDVAASLRNLRMRYPEMIELLQRHGWFCHRRDLDSSAAESWHQNYLGQDAARYLAEADPQASNTWAWPVEARIAELYGEAFKLSDLEAQQALAALRFYTGDLDGALGPLAREAVGAFQRAWGLPDDGVAGPRTRRVLAVVTADVELLTIDGGPA